MRSSTPNATGVAFVLLSLLAGCGIMSATIPSGTASVDPGQKWSKPFVNKGGDYNGELTWDATGGTVNMYFLTEPEWNKWVGGAAPETLTFAGKKMGAASGDMTCSCKADTTYVL